jgi:cell division protein FtsN
MARNEEGEFELVVGNRQLLSIVFILMVLFGVVFSMGYFVGRAHSGPDETAAAQPPVNQQGRPTPVGAEAPPAVDSSLQPGEAKVTTPETAAATSSTAAAPAAATPEPTPAPTPAPPPARTPPPAPPSTGPQPGQTFLQVAAVGKPQADMLVEVLKEKGFPVVVAPVSPDSQLYRTLVGPLKNAAEVSVTRTRLENAGFKPIVKRY